MSKVLLVDDDRALLDMAAALLVHAQFDVTCCENAIDALDLVRNEAFDVVVTDANMTPYSGFDLIRSIKLIPDYQLVPIAMLTGRREKRDVERALQVGAQDYIVKPLDPEHFIKKISELAVISASRQRTARFAELPVDEVATCELAVVVTGLNETGVLIDSDHALLIGSTLTLDCELFRTIGTPRPVVQVLSCTPNQTTGAFDVRAAFSNMEEKHLVKIRQYVHARAVESKRSSKAS